MNFNTHSELTGKHALIGASKYQWLNYDDDKIIDILRKYNRVQLGTWLHAFAAAAIKRCIKLPKSRKSLVSMIEMFFAGSANPVCPPGVYSALYDVGDQVYSTLINYVNDAIGYRMEPEVILKYSDISFGTTDAVSFENDILRIHDLKTGEVPAHMEQLMIYAALYCLEYKTKPRDISVELRIYQNDEILIEKPDKDDLAFVCDRIINATYLLQSAKDREG